MLDELAEPRPAQNMVDWLHSELQAVKQLTGHLSQQTEQLRSAFFELGDQNESSDGRFDTIEVALQSIPQLFDEVGQIRDEVVHLREEQVTLRSLLDEIARGWVGEFERDRRERTELYRRIEAVQREVEGITNRQNHVEEATRHAHEGVAETHHEIETTQRSIEAMERRVDRSIEAANRIDSTAALFAAAIDSLKNQDDVLTERVRLAGDVARRVEEELTAVKQEHGLYHVILDKIELQRAERVRVDDRLAELDAGVDEMRGRFESLIQALTALDGRTHGHGERLNLVQNDMEVVRVQIMEQLQKMADLQERLRRKRLEELDREVKELKRYTIKLAEENGSAYGDGR
jgi:chromosome segregation ATPase